ncbi:MAG: YraN family protein [Acidimicrobiales bacterium]|nr:YraN family protein [Acidimicrobiales bacterium]
MADGRRALGAAGEARAAAWYEAHGYVVVARNWRCREGEIDLVVRRRRQLVFVEVKTRRTDRFGVPAEAVTPTKQRRLRALAHHYLEATGARPSGLRFDVVSILAGRLEVIEGAFLATDPAAAAAGSAQERPQDERQAGHQRGHDHEDVGGGLPVGAVRVQAHLPSIALPGAPPDISPFRLSHPGPTLR